MLRKTGEVITSELGEPFLQKESKCKKYSMYLLPLTHALSIGCGILIGLKICGITPCDGSL